MTFEIKDFGYGSNPIAMFNKQHLPEISSHEIVDASNTGIGFYRIFKYSGPYISGGYFEYQNTSINKPHNIASTEINITPA